MANAIRNKLIERFGESIANATSASQVELRIPPRYSFQKERFVSIVKSIYLNLSQQDKKARIAQQISNLTSAGDRQAAEVSLEALGRESIKPLKPLLKSNDQEVRFSAARCMLNLGSDDGLDALRAIVFDKNSNYRKQAIEAIAIGAKRNDIANICRRVLKDDDVEVQLAAYDQLRKLDDIAIVTEVVGGSFLVQQVALSERKFVHVRPVSRYLEDHCGAVKIFSFNRKMEISR